MLVANRTFAIASSRVPLIRRLRASGWDVVVAAAEDRTAETLRAEGVRVEPVAFARGGFAPGADYAAYRALQRIYGREQPALVHHFHAKPIILGARVARQVASRPRVVNTVTGLGHGFLGNGLRGRLARAGYRGTPSRSDAFIFQNPDDRREFLRRGLADAARTHLIVGSGVDLRRFTPAPGAAAAPLRVAMIARLLWDKGIREFVDAARLVRARHPSIEFVLGGEWDHAHPNAVPEAWVRAQEAAGTIRFVGYVTDMPTFLRGLGVFVLPSYYGEGVPRVLLEAAASGVPVVTADEPGCREALVEGETGALVGREDARAIADAVGHILGDPARLAQMRAASRALAERQFDIEAITEAQVAVYRSVGCEVA